ncbi:cytochrome P450 4C1-like [Sitophilus oryzae]|uniref:Cytochrome P450 4C1-like n=1 Tax=Sitophilus oryzae TaxID=7048 RepID=A0A6J2Y2J3_SITOR|nr:cytochrome P450 4C1-like [Sitophilus oryzae]
MYFECSIILLGVLILLINYYKDIKELIRYRRLSFKFPIADGNIFFLGNLLDLASTNEHVFNVVRKWNQSEHLKPAYLATAGPAYFALNVVCPDIVEAIISSTKHLQKSAIYSWLERWLGLGLLTNTGDSWQARRKILTPAFHFSILQGFISLFNDETRKMVKLVKDCHLNTPVNVAPIASDAALYGINGTSMGIRLDKVEGGAEYQKNIHKLSNSISLRSVRPWYFNDIFYFFITTAGRYEYKLTNAVHRFVDDIIKKKATTFETFNISSDKNYDQLEYQKKKLALLDLLLNDKIKNNSIDDQGIRDEVNTFMFEGHDTTAANLTFTLMLLACHRKIQDEVYEEIIHILGTNLEKEPTYNDLQEMSLMERCIKESLRLYPSVPFIGRITSEDIVTKAGIIPKGLSTHIHIYDIHRDPKYWPNPEKFEPSRFLPENCRDRHPYSYIPFSGGPRNCIGQRFAILEVKTVLCGILRNFILEPVDTPETLVLIQELILRSRDGVKIKFVPREK